MSESIPTLEIFEIGFDQFDLVWPIYRAVVEPGDTYSYAPDTTFEQARAMWLTPPARTFAAREAGQVVGAYILRPNQPGLGSHVANAGYMVAPQARGRGIASALCEHSMATARAANFKAMQFNFVVASNTVAVRLWQKHGFEIVGTVPKAFAHKQLGLVDVYVMHRFL